MFDQSQNDAYSVQSEKDIVSYSSYKTHVSSETTFDNFILDDTQKQTSISNNSDFLLKINKWILKSRWMLSSAAINELLKILTNEGFHILPSS